MATRPTTERIRYTGVGTPERVSTLTLATIMPAVLIILFGIGVALASFLFSGDEVSVSTVLSDSGSVVLSQENVATQPKVQKPVAPVVPPLQLDWEQLGTANLGTGGASRFIPLDDLVDSRRGAVDPIPDGVNPVVDFIRAGNFNIPPAREDNPAGPNTKVYGYVLEGDTVILYGNSDYLATKDRPFLTSYWKAEIPLSKIEGASR